MSYCGTSRAKALIVASRSLYPLVVRAEERYSPEIFTNTFPLLASARNDANPGWESTSVDPFGGSERPPIPPWWSAMTGIGRLSIVLRMSVGV